MKLRNLWSRDPSPPAALPPARLCALICFPAAGIAALLANVCVAVAQERGRVDTVADEPTVVDAPVIVDVPAFPGVFPREVVRLWAGSFFAPEARFGDQEISLSRPEIRVRTDVPFAGVANLQLAGDFSTSFYDSDGARPPPADCTGCSLSENLYSASLAAQGGYRLNDRRHWIVDHEQWAALVSVFVQARWESGAFLDSLTPGISIAIGYQLPHRLRLAVGGRLGSSLDGEGISVNPSVYLRWDVVPRLRIKSRGLGGQLEYSPNKRLDVFLTGFRQSDAFRLDRGDGVPAGSTFQDRQALVGAGMVYRLIRKLRLAAEFGAIIDRRLSFSTRGDGRIDSRTGRPSPYLALRAELRM